jgi:hypothetical protein
MNQRSTYLTMLVVALGIFLGTATSAQAISQPTFDANPQPGYVNEPITLTDTSGSSGVHEWDCHYGDETPAFTPEQTGLTATCIYPKNSGQMVTAVAQRVTDGPNQMIYSASLVVQDRSDQPFDTILASPAAITVPADLVKLQTTKSELSATCITDGGQQCPADVVGRSGPDASGLYTYSVRIMNAAVGPGTVLDTTASNGVGTPSDRKSFDLTVVANRNSPFGLVKREFLTCQPHPKQAGKYQVGASLDYYQSGDSDPSRVTVTLLRKQTTGGYAKVKKASGSVEPGFSQWFEKTNAALATLSAKAVESKDFKVKATISAGKDLKKKTKRGRLTPAGCS